MMFSFKDSDVIVFPFLQAGKRKLLRAEMTASLVLFDKNCKRSDVLDQVEQFTKTKTNFIVQMKELVLQDKKKSQEADDLVQQENRTKKKNDKAPEQSVVGADDPPIIFRKLQECI